MRPLRASVVLLALAAGAAPLAPSELVAPPAFAVDAVDEKLAQFEELLKGGDEGKILAAIVEFQDNLDPRITAKLVEPPAAGAAGATKAADIFKSSRRFMSQPPRLRPRAPAPHCGRRATQVRRLPLPRPR